MKTALGFAVALALLAPAGELELNKPVPDVALGKDLKLSSLTKEGKVVAVYFWSSDCPFGPPMFNKIKEVSAKYAENGKVAFLCISSFGEPADKGNAWAKDVSLKTPFIYDDGRAIAKHFNATKVNATFVIDAKGNLVYRGGFVTKESDTVVEAINAALEGKAAPKSDGAFQGCKIKI
jgi:thiol-disulfide isomerase/thioredoxin